MIQFQNCFKARYMFIKHTVIFSFGLLYSISPTLSVDDRFSVINCSFTKHANLNRAYFSSAQLPRLLPVL